MTPNEKICTDSDEKEVAKAKRTAKRRKAFVKAMREDVERFLAVVENREPRPIADPSLPHNQ